MDVQSSKSNKHAAFLVVLWGGFIIARNVRWLKFGLRKSKYRLTFSLRKTGITINFTYNTSGTLSKVSNGFRDLNFVYDTFKQLASINDGNARVVTFTIDAATGNLTVVQDPLLKSTTYQYDQRGRLTKVFKPAFPTAAVVSNTYDSLSRVKEQLDAYGNLWQFFVAGSRSEEVAPNNSNRVLYFNSRGNTLREINALGKETTNNFDGIERLIQMTMPEGNSSLMTYDAVGNVTSVTQKAKPGSGLSDRISSFTYDSVWTSKVKTTTDASGSVTTTTYAGVGANGAGREVKVEQPSVAAGVPTTLLTYNTKGQLLTKTDPTGRVQSNVYEAVKNNLLSSTIDPTGLALTTSATYDSVGNVATTTDAMSNVTSAIYDKNRRLTQITGPAPLNELSFVTYDDNGNVTQIQHLDASDMCSQIETLAYSIDGLPLNNSGPANFGQGAQPIPMKYEYDSLRRLSKATDAAGVVIQTNYDALSRPVSTLVDGVTQDSGTYTDNGHASSYSDPKGNTTLYTYDGFDRPIRATFPDLSFKSLSYDVRDNIISSRNRDGTTIDFTHDALGRILTKTPSGEAVTTLDYDLASRPTSFAKPLVIGDPSTGAFLLAYDAAGRLQQEQYPDGKTVTYTRDKNGNVTKVTYPDGSEVNQTFDSLKRLTSVSGLGGSTAYSYDSASRRISKINGNKTATGFNFDKLDDLLSFSIGGITPNSINVPANVNFSFVQNNVSQRIFKQCSDPTFDWQPSVFRTRTYGAANNLNQYPSVDSATLSYEANGNLESDGTSTYSYDREQRLVSANATGGSVSFKYDPRGRLAEKTVGGTKTRYLYAGLQRIEEYGSSGLSRRFVFGEHLDDCIYAVNVSSGEVTYLHADDTGSIILTTNASGVALEKNVYTPWGDLASGSLTSNPFGFTGQIYEPELDLYFFKARHYSPKLGRFLQPDPIGYDGGHNLYSYCGNDPINYSDPLGLQPVVLVRDPGLRMPFSLPGYLQVNSAYLRPNVGGFYGSGGSGFGSFNFQFLAYMMLFFTLMQRLSAAAARPLAAVSASATAPAAVAPVLPYLSQSVNIGRVAPLAGVAVAVGAITVAGVQDIPRAIDRIKANTRQLVTPDMFSATAHKNSNNYKGPAYVYELYSPVTLATWKYGKGTDDNGHRADSQAKAHGLAWRYVARELPNTLAAHIIEQGMILSYAIANNGKRPPGNNDKLSENTLKDLKARGYF